MSTWLRILIAQALTVPALVLAEDGPPQDIARELEAEQRGSGDWLYPLFDDWDRARTRFQEKSQLNWSASYHSVLLGAALGNGFPTGASGDFTLQGVWTPTGYWVDNPTEIRFRMRDRHAYGGRAASELGPDLGAAWGLVDGFSNSGFEVPDFFLRHHFDEAGLELRYGQLSIDSQFGSHQLASSKSFFLNQGFASNPAVAFPRFGAGFTALKTFDNGFSVGLGSTTVQGTQTGDQVNLQLGSDDLFHALQFAYDFKDSNELPRRLQMLVWHSDAVNDANRPEGQGVSFTYEQQLDSAGTRYFIRGAWSDGGAAALDYLVAGGVVFPVNGDDLFGVAASVGRGSSGGQPIQGILETFYRWQPRRNFTVSPDLQLLVGEGLNGGPGVRLIGGLRLKLSF
ncbi:hypothetical protein HAHE_35480 [Haloferula helveola]|uniref:Porin n=1 Tax=Haloferula helveola TaxID=490095 RepID=A0ABM7RH92_9BACT|nr:hypothetical protein HAHE_35480 [Haloferula helveola]